MSHCITFHKESDMAWWPKHKIWKLVLCCNWFLSGLQMSENNNVITNIWMRHENITLGLIDIDQLIV